jgi:hypothetical protein
VCVGLKSIINRCIHGIPIKHIRHPRRQTRPDPCLTSRSDPDARRRETGRARRTRPDVANAIRSRKSCRTDAIRGPAGRRVSVPVPVPVPAPAPAPGWSSAQSNPEVKSCRSWHAPPRLHLQTRHAFCSKLCRSRLRHGPCHVRAPSSKASGDGFASTDHRHWD